MTPQQSSRRQSVESIIKKLLIPVLAGAAVIVSFQNCGQPGGIVTSDIHEETANATVPTLCNGTSCELTPLTDKPAVTTLLMALGDQVNSQLVVNGASAQYIVESIVRYTTPVKNPKILIVRAARNMGESSYDTIYLHEVLLGRYGPQLIDEPESGLAAADLQGFDIVWFNNPGYPMSSVKTRDTLMQFAGGVVLQGDDMSWGLDANGKIFSVEALTGLHFLDNGSSVVCDGVSYNHDGNSGEQFRVSLSADKFPGVDASLIELRYGNDIDNSVVSLDKLEVMATAIGGPASCKESRPTIVRYKK